MKTRITWLAMLLAVLFLTAGCGGNALENGDITLSVDKDGQLQIGSPAAKSPLLGDLTQLASLTVGGEKIVFTSDVISGGMVSDAFGKGRRVVLEAKSAAGIEREVTVTAYDRYPSTLVVRAEYENESGADVAVDGWSVCDLQVKTAGDDPCFWSFQGQSTEERDDWIRPVGDGFFQRNYMGMNNSDYGGGVPAVCLWRRDAGVMIGHLAPNPILVSLPARKPGRISPRLVLLRNTTVRSSCIRAKRSGPAKRSSRSLPVTASAHCAIMPDCWKPRAS